MDNDLQKMFIEDAPQDVDNLTGVNNLSTLVIELQKLEDEIENDEERLKLKKKKQTRFLTLQYQKLCER